TQSRDMTERIYEFSTMLVRDRLIMELVRLGREEGTGTRSIEVPLAPTREVLARKIATHREQVSREFTRLKRIGLISQRKQTIVLHDLEALSALATHPGSQKAS
ncbi:MAG: helix-turn-helix domain-containing protein, partial [Pseudomonadota bacterium]